MRLYLVQHGEAKSEEEDPERSLTAQGERDATDVAEFLHRAEIEVSEIRCSGKRRAQQTAAIMAEHLQPPRGVQVVEGLGPNDKIEPVALALATENEPLMLVGHLPFLERLASKLLMGDPNRGAIRFKMAGVLCLERHDHYWSVVWMVTPELLREEKPR